MLSFNTIAGFGSEEQCLSVSLLKAEIAKVVYMEFLQKVSWMLYWVFNASLNAQKMKVFIKDFFSKCDQIHTKLRIWSHLLMKSLMENVIFCVESALFSCIVLCVYLNSLP